MGVITDGTGFKDNGGKGLGRIIVLQVYYWTIIIILFIE